MVFRLNKTWWKEAVVYQIYPRSFLDSNGDGIGDLNGIVSKLDYIKELGVDVIWLSPVYKSPNDDNGYDISDYRDIMDEFGTMEDWENMLKEIHKRGLKCIMDLVINHSSDEHKWFEEARKSMDNPYRDYYIWRPARDGKEPNNWRSFFSGSAWEYDQKTAEYYLHLFSKKQPDLNWENPRLRRELYEMMTFWLEKGIDGFRMDVINCISKTDGLPDGSNPTGERYVDGSDYYLNGPRIHEFLREMNEQVLSQYDILTVGEMPEVTPEQAKVYTTEENNEVNMVFQFDHMSVDSGPNGKWDLAALNLVKLKKILTKWQNELHEVGWNSLYWNNHDQPRIVSRFGDDSEERVKSAKMLATCLHMLEGTPYIYQGEEIGMTNVSFSKIEDYQDIETVNMYNEQVAKGVDPDKIVRAIQVKGRDNARTPFQWDDSEHAGFTTGTPWMKVNPNYLSINAVSAVADPDSIYNYYKKLNSLRKQHDIIVYGDFILLLEQDSNLFVYLRSDKSGQRLLVLNNFSGSSQKCTLPKTVSFTSFEKWIGNYDYEHNTLSDLILQPWESAVYLLK